MPETPARNTGAHFVYRELKRRILNLELKPGERIYEPAMASELSGKPHAAAGSHQAPDR